MANGLFISCLLLYWTDGSILLETLCNSMEKCIKIVSLRARESGLFIHNSVFVSGGAPPRTSNYPAPSSSANLSGGETLQKWKKQEVPDEEGCQLWERVHCSCSGSPKWAEGCGYDIKNSTCSCRVRRWECRGWGGWLWFEREWSGWASWRRWHLYKDLKPMAIWKKVFQSEEWKDQRPKLGMYLECVVKQQGGQGLESSGLGWEVEGSWLRSPEDTAKMLAFTLSKMGGTGRSI